MAISTILQCFLADEELFAPEDRYAEGSLTETIAHINSKAGRRVSESQRVHVCRVPFYHCLTHLGTALWSVTSFVPPQIPPHQQQNRTLRSLRYKKKALGRWS